MKLAALIAAAITIAAPAMAQWNTTTVPFGNGWSSQSNGPNGQSVTGSSVPFGNGWSTNYNDNQGRSTTCSSVPFGNGYSTTCQ